MFRNYLTIAWRNLMRQKGYSLLNILGLALGMAVALLIFSYVRVDLRWDRWHENSDLIVRPVELQDFGGDERTDVAVTMSPLGPMLVEELPEVETMTRVMHGWRPPVVMRGEKRLYESSTAYVDSTFFQVFSFKLLQGDPETALTRRDAVVLTETARDRYFEPDENPIGQILRINSQRDVVVTAISEDPPPETHLRYAMLFPFDAGLDDQRENLDDWGSNFLATYLKLVAPENMDTLASKVTEAYHRHGDWAELEFWVQPLNDMHLNSEHIEIDINPGKSSMNNVYALGAVGLFILLLACINFMNLSTARAITRAREVGLRKVSGARKRELIFQFLGESLLVSFFAMLLAALVVELAGPWFADVSGRALEFAVFSGSFATWMLLGLGAAVGILAGLYPAFVLSSFRPVTVLKSADSRSTMGGGRLRRVLVVFQFAISIGLIIATGVVYAQLQYGLTKPLGFDKENVLVIPIPDQGFWDNYEDHLNSFSKVPGVVDYALSSRVPSRGGSSSGFIPEGSDRSRVINWNSVSAGGDKVFGWDVLDGRFFDEELTTDRWLDGDTTGVMLMNEAAAKQFGWDDPIGKTVKGFGNVTFNVIGLIRDYHFSSLHTQIEPMLLVNLGPAFSLVSIRYNRPDAHAFVQDLEAVWDERFPDRPFDYFFLDENFDSMFRTEERQAHLFQAFSIVAVVIACLGILGLAAFSTGRRTREIAVRKVLGASEGRIFGLLTREFAILVLLANVIAWPVTYYLMSKWFETFAYRAPWPWWVFPAAAGGTLLLALLTVGLQAIKAVRLRPARALRYE